MTNFKDFLTECLKDPEIKAEYDALEPEFAIIQAIIDARKSTGITQKQLADLAGMAQSNISEIEKGIRPLGLNVAKNLAKALKCHYKDLLEG